MPEKITAKYNCNIRKYVHNEIRISKFTISKVLQNIWIKPSWSASVRRQPQSMWLCGSHILLWQVMTEDSKVWWSDERRQANLYSSKIQWTDCYCLCIVIIAIDLSIYQKYSSYTITSRNTWFISFLLKCFCSMWRLAVTEVQVWQNEFYVWPKWRQCLGARVPNS